MDTMRERFAAVATELLDEDPRLAVVLAEISADSFAAGRGAAPGPGDQRRDPRAAAGRRGRRAGADRDAADRAHVRQVPGRAALRAGQAGLRPPGRGRGAGQRRRLLRRAAGGRTHQAPGDVALLDTLRRLDRARPRAPRRGRGAAAARRPRGDGRVYVRLSARANAEPRPVAPGRFQVVRRGRRGDRARGRADARRGAGRDRGPRRHRAVRGDRAAVRRGDAARQRCDGRRTSCWSSRTSRARRAARWPRRCATCRTGCSRSGVGRARAAPVRHRRPSTRPRTAWTPGGCGTDRLVPAGLGPV